MGRSLCAVWLCGVVGCGFPKLAPVSGDDDQHDAAGDGSTLQYFDMSDLSRWTEFHNMNLSSLAGGTFDGRFIYFPSTDTGTYPIWRYDTQAPFDLTSSWLSFFAIGTGTPPAESTYRGAVLAAGFVLFPPATAGHVVLRYDTAQGFAVPASWDTFDISVVDGGIRPFDGAVFDGNFVYLVPGVTDHSDILRYDTTKAFGTASSWQVFAPAATFPAASLAPFHGAIFDGAHVDILPGHNVEGDDWMLQYDVSGTFTDGASWKALNTYSINGNAANASHGAFDGTYVYISPGIGNFKVALRARHDSDFANPNSWEAFDLTAAAPVVGTYAASTFDGRFIYMIPSSVAPNAILLRFDTTKSFTDPASWQSFDLSMVMPGGYSSAVFDGHYLYFEPASTNSVLRFEAREPGALPDFYATGSFF